MVSQRSLRKKFNILLIEAIDEAISSPGESSKTAIYYHLETAFNIKKQEIPNKVDVFSRALERLFGFGAKHLEILFMKSLSAKVREAIKNGFPANGLCLKYICGVYAFDEAEL